MHPLNRNLTFAAVFNFRDIGGYAGQDGRTVRWRRLFRSDSLHRIDTNDAEEFGTLGVRTVIDLRRDFEIASVGRVPHHPGLEYRHIPIRHLDWNEVDFPADMPLPRWLADRYLNFAEDGGDGLADALRVIADPHRAPAVVHCMAGKDRTGVVCALTLSLLGVDDADVASDYALSTAAMTALSAYLRRVQAGLAGDDVQHYFTCPAEAMLLFLADLRARHGSIEGYVRDIGLATDDIAALREHMLQ